MSITFLVKIPKNREISEGVYINGPEIINLNNPIEMYSNEPGQEMTPPMHNEFIAFILPTETPEKSFFSKYYVKKFVVLCDFKMSTKNLTQIIDAIRRYEFYNNIGVDILKAFNKTQTEHLLGREDIVKFIKNSTGYSKEIILRDYSSNISTKEKEEIFLEHIDDYNGIMRALGVWGISDKIC